MEGRRIAATAAAVFLTTAAGMVAVGANLGLLRLGASDSKVGTLSPIASPAPSVPAAPLGPSTATSAAPTPDPAANATPVADQSATNATTWNPAPASTTWVTTDTSAAAAPPSSVAPAPSTAAPAAEPGDGLPVVSATPAGGSGDD